MRKMIGCVFFVASLITAGCGPQTQNQKHGSHAGVDLKFEAIPNRKTETVLIRNLEQDDHSGWREEISRDQGRTWTRANAYPDHKLLKSRPGYSCTHTPETITYLAKIRPATSYENGVMTPMNDPEYMIVDAKEITPGSCAKTITS
jgi:hypothetical protein